MGVKILSIIREEFKQIWDDAAAVGHKPDHLDVTRLEEILIRRIEKEGIETINPGDPAHLRTKPIGMPRNVEIIKVTHCVKSEHTEDRRFVDLKVRGPVINIHQEWEYQEFVLRNIGADKGSFNWDSWWNNGSHPDRHHLPNSNYTLRSTLASWFGLGLLPTTLPEGSFGEGPEDRPGQGS